MKILHGDQKKMTIETVGWLGAFIILSTYFLGVVKELKFTDLIFLSLNLLGCFLLFVHSFWLHNYPAATINFCFILISSYGIYANRDDV
jgi:hypothetical protein